MNCTVHLFCIVRVKVEDVEADSHEEAIELAKSHYENCYYQLNPSNPRVLPDGIGEVEFAEEFSHFLVDEDGDPEHERSAWFDAQGRLEPFTVEEPLSAQEFRKRIDADGRVRLAVPVSLDELYNCRGIDGLNDLVDSRLYGDGVHGCLSDVCYRPLRILEDERVLIDVIGRADELELDGVAAWHCRICGDAVEHTQLRQHLVEHNPNAQGMDYEDVVRQYRTGEGSDATA